MDSKRPDDVVPDLLAVLDELAEDAKAAIDSLAGGRSLNGRGALQRIQHRAQDAARHAREDLQEDAA